MDHAHGIDAAALLKRARERSGLTQRALAKRAGTSQSVVARIELGDTNPTVATLNRLLAAAGARPAIELHPLRAVVPTSRELSERVRRFFSRDPVPGVASVYLFGGAARGTLHRDSDLDVAVLVDHGAYPTRPERSDLRIRLASALTTASGMNEVDLVILNDVPATFARAIVLDGVRLIRKDRDVDHAFVRDTQLRAADLEPFLARMRAIKLRRLRV
jgi:transcriptional regulator with XRE-family HTH domain